MQFNTYDAIHFPYSDFYPFHFPLIHLTEQDKTEARSSSSLAVLPGQILALPSAK